MPLVSPSPAPTSSSSPAVWSHRRRPHTRSRRRRTRYRASYRHAIITDLYKRFAARQIVMPPNNSKQADILDGAIMIDNKNGSAPAQYLDTAIDGHRKIIVLLPGPPKSSNRSSISECKPRLAVSLPTTPPRQSVLRMALIPESHVDARTAPIYPQFTDVETTILAGPAEIQLHFLCANPSLAQAQARVDELTEKIEAEMDDAHLLLSRRISRRGRPPATSACDLSLATAESCTGGLLAQRLTPSPAAHAIFSAERSSTATRSRPPSPNVPPELLPPKGLSPPK